MNWLDFALGLAAAVTVVSALGLAGGKLIKWLWSTGKKINLFFEDFYGEPARPGFPEKKGLMERVQNIESIQAENSEMIQKIWSEQMPNSGKSQRDDIARIHQAVTGNEPPLYESRKVANANE